VKPGSEIPHFFRVRQKFDRPRVGDFSQAVQRAIASARLSERIRPGQSIAITAGSRGIANIATILKAIVAEVKKLGGIPFLVPAMGSHGGGTVEGQLGVLADYGVTAELMGCEIRASMETHVVCQAAEGFPVHFDTHAHAADHVLVVNRIKPHTRFYGSVESGLMKMMLIGLGNHHGALVYHRVIQDYTFDQIVHSVAREVIARCRVVGGIGILENAYEETADIVGMEPQSIGTIEPVLLNRVKQMLPKLPFDHAELLLIDAIGKNISGSGMDTNVVGRKTNDSSALGDEKPRIHHIYVRGLAPATHGNATGIGIAEMCHRRVIEQLDPIKTRINCITASHIAAAALPVDFENDRQALQSAINMGGWYESRNFTAMWIPNTLHLEEVECSEVFRHDDRNRMTDFEVIAEPRALEFDAGGDLVERFPTGEHCVA
jgi:hypothetical protein